MAVIDERANLRHLGDIEVEAVVELGRQRVALSQARQLRPGDVLVLDTLAGSAFALRVNGARLAEGETVVVGGRMALRLTEMGPLPVEEGPEEREGGRDG